LPACWRRNTSAWNREGNEDIWTLPLAGDRKPTPLVETPFDERDSHFSPDARWLASTSNESGTWEVYVRPFPSSISPGARRQISTGGGSRPRWRRDGREIFYLARDRALMAVAVRSGALFEAGAPQRLLRVFWSENYAVTPDGSRILAVVPAAFARASSLRVVTNWFAGLRH